MLFRLDILSSWGKICMKFEETFEKLQAVTTRVDTFSCVLFDFIIL